MTAGDLLICGHLNNHSSTREEKLGYTAWTLLEEAMDRTTATRKIPQQEKHLSRTQMPFSAEALVPRGLGTINGLNRKLISLTVRIRAPPKQTRNL